jgi:hypothetical protein
MLAIHVSAEPVPITLEATATKKLDQWVVDVVGPPHVSVRVSSLWDVEVAVNRALGTKQSVHVHIYWYH